MDISLIFEDSVNVAWNNSIYSKENHTTPYFSMVKSWLNHLLPFWMINSPIFQRNTHEIIQRHFVVVPENPSQNVQKSARFFHGVSKLFTRNSIQFPSKFQENSSHFFPSLFPWLPLCPGFNWISDNVVDPILTCFLELELLTSPSRTGIQPRKK